MKTFYRILVMSLLIVGTADAQQLFFRPKKESGPASPTDTILWWKFNEGTGTAVTTPAGTATSPTWATGLSGSGGCIDFNGSSTRVGTDAALDIGANVATVAFLFNPDATNATDIICITTNVNGFTVQINPPFLSVSINGDSGVRTERTQVGIDAGVTHSYIVTIDGSTTSGDVKIYIDGVEVSTTTSSNTKAGTSNFQAVRTWVGANQAGAFLCDGKIDDVRIYNRIITDAEAVQISADRQ